MIAQYMSAARTPTSKPCSTNCPCALLAAHRAAKNVITRHAGIVRYSATTAPFGYEIPRDE